MPIYAYRCAECGQAHDALQKMSDAPLIDCPACGKPALAKQVTAAGFQLKGSGWYVTDFRNNGGGGKSSSTGSSSGGSTDAGSGSTSSSSSTSEPAAAAPPPSSTPAA